MAGLLEGFGDFIKTPEGQGLLSAAFGGLAGARQGAPLNSLGRAGMAGLSGFGNALERQAQQGEAEQMKKYRDAQIANYQAEIESRKATQEALKNKQDILSRLYESASAGAPALNTDLFLPPEMRTGMSPIAAVPARSAGINSALIPSAIKAGVTAKDLAELDGLRNLGQQEVARTIKGIGPDGREYEYQIDKYGKKIGDGFGQFRAPIEVALGDKKQMIDPYTLQPKASFVVGQSPDSKASNALGWANNSISSQRLNWDMNGGGEGGTSQAGFNKQFGKPAAGYRWKADGSQEFIPGGPADQKAQLAKSGEGTVQGVVADLRDKYTVLDSENGIVSTKNRIGTNLGAWAGSTGIGQTANGMVGTKTQSARDSIAMTRPLLLQAIMKATGMSAKQMDSNAELKIYLATATDPQKGLEANLEALDRIESLYGGGSEKFKAKTPQASTSNGWSMEKVR
jgi:hypothetical protein